MLAVFLVTVLRHLMARVHVRDVGPLGLLFGNHAVELRVQRLNLALSLISRRLRLLRGGLSGLGLLHGLIG